MAGRGVVHFEISAANVKRAKDFYNKAFGWNINEYPGMDYNMVGTTESDQNGMPKNPGAINGGLMKRHSHKNPVSSTVITIDLDDINDSFEEDKRARRRSDRQEDGRWQYGFRGVFQRH